MPANVESMFSVNETPWHNLGVVLREAPTLVEGFKLAGLDWQVLMQSLLRTDGENVDEFAKVFVRSDNGKTLSVVGPKTHILQNAEAFEFFQPFLDANECTLETAGSLDEGRKIWVLAKINRENAEIVKGDSVAKFVLLSNSHDGTAAVRMGYTPIRIVCANTLAMAHSHADSKLIRVRHSKEVSENVKLVQNTMKIADEAFEATAEQYRFLASRQINAADLRKYVKEVFDMDEDETKIKTKSMNVLNEIIRKHTEKVDKARIESLYATLKPDSQVIAKENTNILEAVIANMEAGRGTENANSRGSFWTAYNAITEYLSYERGHNEGTRLKSLWFGDNAKVNAEALQVALEHADYKAG